MEYSKTKIILILAVAFILDLILVWGLYKLTVKNKSVSKYPINVVCKYYKNDKPVYIEMECNAIRGDSLWKDGEYIVTKNIVNVSFK